MQTSRGGSSILPSELIRVGCERFKVTDDVGVFNRFEGLMQNRWLDSVHPAFCCDIKKTSQHMHKGD